MKSLSLFLSLLLFAPFCFAQDENAKEEAVEEVEAEEISVKPELRTFTSVDGKKIQAALVDRDDENQTFKLLVKGRSTPSTIPFDKISPEDLDYIKRWPKAKSIFLQKCRGLTVRQLLELRGYESIPFKFEGNAIMITGKLNGKEAKVQVDTGAGTTLLHAPFTEAAGCKIGPMNQKIWGVAGFQPAGTAEIPKLELGSSVFLDEEIQAADRDFNMPKGFKRHEDILLGAEYLIKLEAVISYKERTIFFRPDNSDIAQI
ncbi:aspartyl protease family protein, partial [Akkermansiaceae bacterium]|nr:aspartyl protease family protein [Akkermansiaceae bacterium]